MKPDPQHIGWILKMGVALLPVTLEAREHAINDAMTRHDLCHVRQ
ncbi:MAG: hypothetical protein AB7P24_12855 [Nitrospira sp.]